MKEFFKYVLFFIGFLIHRNRYSKVIFYHDVNTSYTDMGTPIDTIKSHLDVIKGRGFTLVKNITQKTDQIMICFDDGWKGLYDNKDFFVKNKIYPTVFVAVDLIGSDGYMSVEEIKELYGLGFEIEGHTWTHTGLPDHHGDDLKHELIESKQKLEEMLGFEIHDICFPQGRYTNEAIRISKAAGYRYLYTSTNGSYQTLEQEGLICRNLLQYTPSNQVKFIIEGDSPLYRKKLLKMHYE